MAVYKWKGKNRQGVIQNGEIEGDNKDVIIEQLRKQQIMIMEIKPKLRNFDINIPGMGPTVTDKDVVTFTRQFATMIDAGLPLVQCLNILSSQSDNKLLAKTISQVQGDVESGSTFADALSKHPKIFNDLYVNMVTAGEAAGILDTILNRLAGYIEKNIALKKQVKSAMVYPSTILAVAIVVVVGLLVFVIPTFAQMFTDMGGTLPAPTRIVMQLSDFMVAYWHIFLIVGGGSFFGIKQYYRTKNGRKVIDALLLKIPVLGDLIRKVAVAKFTRTLGTLISSGVPILDGLDIVARTAGNKIVEEAIIKTRSDISEGKTIAEPLQQTKVFPPMVVQMIAVGESAGALDAMLGKIADFYDEEVDTAVSALTSLLEPMLMVFLGVVLGFIVIAMYLPIFEMAASM